MADAEDVQNRRNLVTEMPTWHDEVGRPSSSHAVPGRSVWKDVGLQMYLRTAERRVWATSRTDLWEEGYRARPKQDQDYHTRCWTHTIRILWYSTNDVESMPEDFCRATFERGLDTDRDGAREKMHQQRIRPGALSMTRT